mmetsp:Transcript_64761/g.141978  ORF Transcript_64761/g.141978 Transcript_64761/m.141978 type:complete len:84 (+) Transcript_64761:213-464(+)
MLSNADVASSSKRTLGLRSKTRAMTTRCLWPPDKRSPRGPTSVCNPSGSSWIKSHALALLHASITSSSKTRGAFSSSGFWGIP